MLNSQKSVAAHEKTTPSHMTTIAFDPKHPGVAYGAGPTLIVRSTDDGATWTPIAPAVTPLSYLTVDSGGNVYYAATGYGAGVNVSRDGGATWTNRPFQGNVGALAADPDSPAVYAAADGQVLVIGSRLGI